MEHGGNVDGTEAFIAESIRERARTVCAIDEVT
jgi:hypothetical protein